MNSRTRMMRTAAATAVALVMATAGILAQGGAPTSAEKIGTMRIEMLSETASPIYGFSLSIETPTDTSSGGGAGTGKASFSDIAVLRVPDAMSPAMLQAAVTGRHLTRVQIDLKDASYVLTDVLISGYSTTGGLEKVSFAFGRIQFSAGGAATCFDLRTYSAC